jgi:hypothetical protein
MSINPTLQPTQYEVYREKGPRVRSDTQIVPHGERSLGWFLVSP